MNKSIYGNISYYLAYQFKISDVSVKRFAAFLFARCMGGVCLALCFMLCFSGCSGFPRTVPVGTADSERAMVMMSVSLTGDDLPVTVAVGQQSSLLPGLNRREFVLPARGEAGSEGLDQGALFCVTVSPGDTFVEIAAVGDFRELTGGRPVWRGRTLPGRGYYLGHLALTASRAEQGVVLDASPALDQQHRMGPDMAQSAPAVQARLICQVVLHDDFEGAVKQIAATGEEGRGMPLENGTHGWLRRRAGWMAHIEETSPMAAEKKAARSGSSMPNK